MCTHIVPPSLRLFVSPPAPNTVRATAVCSSVSKTGSRFVLRRVGAWCLPKTKLSGTD
uniref:WD_REPEATS_REGION domain-containing protein n=1 Tax=Mesocestoides corti TaxID=53468 RepID=A0A5K3FLC8_MESCO